MDRPMSFRIGDEPGSAVRVGGGQCVRDADERAALPGVTSDGPGDAFRAVRVVGGQCVRDADERAALERAALPGVVGDGLGFVSGAISR